MKLNDIVNEANYGRYYCSTDKKWKTRKGPKQSRKTESVEQGVAESEYGIPDGTLGHLPGGPKMTFGEFKKMWPGVILKRPSGGSLAGSVVADVEGWMNNPKSVWEPLPGVAEGMDKLYPSDRTVIDYMQDNSWLSAERAYFRYIGLQRKKQMSRSAWEEEIQRFIDLYNKHKGPQGVAETTLNPNDPKEDYYTKRKALQDLMKDPNVDQKAVQQRWLDLEKEAKAKGVAEASWINGKKQDDKELVWKQTGMSYEKAVEKYGKEHVRLGGKNKLGQQTVEVHVPLVSEKKKQRLDPKCWDGYKKQGTKMKGGVRVNNCVPEAAPDAVRAAGGLALGSLTGVGGALIGQMFAPFLGGAAGGVVGAVGGYKAGAEMTDALWDKVSSMLGGKDKAVYAGIEHAKAANAGEKTFNYNGKEFPVTLAPQEVKPAISALDSVKESILGELTGKKNWFAEEETYNGDEFYEAYGDLWFNEDEQLDEAEYQGRKVPLGKPMRGDVKKFKVYVKNEKGNVVKVNFGDPDMKIKKSNPARRKSFRARHNCANPGPRTKARYWSCRKW